MIPISHPYIQNYLRFEEVLRPQSNVLRIIVENPEARSSLQRFWTRCAK